MGGCGVDGQSADGQGIGGDGDRVGGMQMVGESDLRYNDVERAIADLGGNERYDLARFVDQVAGGIEDMECPDMALAGRCQPRPGVGREGSDRVVQGYV